MHTRRTTAPLDPVEVSYLRSHWGHATGTQLEDALHRPLPMIVELARGLGLVDTGRPERAARIEHRRRIDATITDSRRLANTDPGQPDDTPPARVRGVKGKRIVWTDDDDATIRTTPVAEAARQLGVSPATISRCRRVLGVTQDTAGTRKGVRWTPDMDALVATQTIAEAARQLGLGTTVISHRRKALGVSKPRRSAA